MSYSIIIYSWIRKNIGYIDQEPVLFAGTIYDNIRYGRPEATYQEVLEAAQLANATSFIESFPNQYDTIVGERGKRLLTKTIFLLFYNFFLECRCDTFWWSEAKNSNSTRNFEKSKDSYSR